MARKSVNVVSGLTQADSVKVLESSSELASGTSTLSLVPSKYKAFPILPAVHRSPLVRLPVFPFPEESAAVVPVPSSNFQ